MDGISISEACSMHALDEESFNRMCNADGSVKKAQSSTTVTFFNSTSVTIPNSILTGVGIAFALVLVVTAYGMVRKFNHKNKS